MEINGPKTPFSVKLFEVLQRSQVFKCACCSSILPTKQAAYVAAYKPRDPVMKKAMPLENGAAYVVCEECARLPEKTVFVRCQKYMIEQGLFEKQKKPLDAPGRHSPRTKKKPLIGQGDVIKFGFN